MAKVWILFKFGFRNKSEILDLFRHTNATLMIANNINMKTVSSRLGHSEIGTTMDIYAHALRNADQQTADTLGSRFFSGQDEAPGQCDTESM